MNRALKRLALLLPPLLAAMLLTVPQPAQAVIGDAELAARWAPIHYQDTDSTNYPAEYLSAVDYDGDWSTINNWENLTRYPLRSTVYYSVVETGTHWFIVYAFYHPRDWDDDYPGTDREHENDLEGLLLTVRKDGTTYGRLEAMVTVAHDDFWSYVPPGSMYTSGRETVDGAIYMQEYGGFYRPTSQQESEGHGIYRWNGQSFPGGDGIVYYPGTVGEVPSGGNDRFVQYQLVDIFASNGMWAHRYDSATFASWGVFRGDNGKDNAANAPWKWDDEDDGSDLQYGLLATDPAKLVSIYFGGEGVFQLSYIRNGYRPSLTSVPDVQGLTAAVAESRLRGVGLAPTTRSVSDATCELTAGTVASQLPVPGTQVAPGSSVQLSVVTTTTTCL